MNSFAFKLIPFYLITVAILLGCSGNAMKKIEPTPSEIQNSKDSTMKDQVIKTEDEWKNILSKEQFEVLRNKGTERPHTGKFDQFFENGSYVCGACGNPLFTSETKFDAGCGWPSFYDVVDKSKVTLHKDNSLGMSRTEVLCARCGGHLGHVFDDGPRPTGLRYCINSVSIDFKKDSLPEKK